MARERHFLIVPSIWEQPWTEDARTLAFYLLTCKHRVTEGLYKLPLSYAADDLDWDFDRLTKPFAELLADGFIEYDRASKMVLLTGALEIQSPANPNVDLAAVRALASFPRTPLFRRLHELAERHCKRFAKALAKAYPERLAESPTPSLTPTPSPTAPPDPPPSAGGASLPKNSRAAGTNPRADAERWASMQPGGDTWIAEHFPDASPKAVRGAIDTFKWSRPAEDVDAGSLVAFAKSRPALASQLGLTDGQAA